MLPILSAVLLPMILSRVQAAAIVTPRDGWRSKIEVIRNPVYPLDVVDQLEEVTMDKVDSYMTKKIAMNMNNNCTLENASVRREWSDLSDTQRQEYIAAVMCLSKLPAKADKTKFPGAISRYDDFVAFHMTHAMQLHDNMHLFGAHKYFVYLFETALRDECGYTGYHPYMNYDRYSKDPLNSPLLNGNASSMGGQGALEPTYKGVSQPGRTPNLIKSGGGGGCLTSGPFSDLEVHLGPTSMATATGVQKNPKSDGTGLNTRCLRRDVNQNAIMGATADRCMSLFNHTDMDGFYNQLLGTPPPKDDPYPWGVHTAGHYVAAVDPGGDAMTSPGDPLFYFHHVSLDRLWWIWQMQDPTNRVYAIPFVNQTITMPMKRDTEATDPNDILVDLEWLGPPIKLLETHDALGGNEGKFCVVYV